MDKIWIVKSRYRYRLYKSESEMVRNLPDSNNYTVTEWTLKSSQTASEYLKSRERDTQLRVMLDELSDIEVNVMNLIKIFSELKNDASTIDYLKKIADNKTAVSNYLTQHKSYFFDISDSVEWILAILKCHNFRDYLGNEKWNAAKRKYEIIDNKSQTFKDNFKLAKGKLKEYSKESRKSKKERNERVSDSIQ